MDDPFQATPTYTVSQRAFDGEATHHERQYAMWSHLVGFVSLSSAGVPFLGLIGTIIMWKIKAGDSPFLDDHGREATNFQLSLLLYTFLGIVFSIVTVGIGAFVAVPLVLALAVIGQVRGAIAAHRGEFYRYPCCIRFMKDQEER